MPNKKMVNLTRLKELMDAKGWRSGELSHYSGVKYNTVYSLVIGRRPNVGAKILKEIADALGTTVEFLMDGEEDEDAPKHEMPESVRNLVRVAARLSEVRQEELLRIAAALEKLEREQEDRPLTDETMRALLEIAKRLKESGANGDVLPLLEGLLTSVPRRWLIDLRSTLGQGSHDPNQNH